MTHLAEAARNAQRNAYAPYSGFAVGAALETAEGDVFVGANVENASFGLTICAERVAVAAAVSAGVRAFSRIVVASNSRPPSAPCGACRQVMREFGSDLTVEAVGPGEVRRWKLSELLPLPFGPDDLG